MHDGYDQHAACRAELKHTIAEMASLPEIAAIIVEEGDQNGVWERRAMIISIHRTPEGLVIRVR
jgi:hypothetical protein